MSHSSNIIEVDSSSEDEGLTNTAHIQPTGVVPTSNGHPLHIGEAAPRRTNSPLIAGHFDSCMKSVAEFFPGISNDHVRDLYQEYCTTFRGADQESLLQLMVDRVLRDGTYPKEKDRKRALSDSQFNQHAAKKEDEQTTRWKQQNPASESPHYAKVCKLALQEAFPFVPSRYLEAEFRLHRHFYGTFQAIAKAERQYNTDAQKSYTKLKCRRYNSAKSSQGLLHSLGAHHFDVTNLELEMEEAKKRKVQDDKEWCVQVQRVAEAAVEEQAERDRGEIIECACCFDDVPMSKVTHCNGYTPHFFCYECARKNAESDVGSNKHSLQCMHESGCEATFGREERSKFLDQKIIDKIDNLEQQSSIQGAMCELIDFVTCPFCHYGQICPPVEEDKEFRCSHPHCREISCRLCKERSHIPLSCQEYQREMGLSERKVIEEARTNALIRTCHKCKVRILKEDGCNKIICTTCASVICDVCGKDITTEGYGHFDDQRTFPGQSSTKCLLFDKPDRKEKQIEEAGRAAVVKIRNENPGLSEEDLRIKFSKDVEGKARLRHDITPHPAMLLFGDANGLNQPKAVNPMLYDRNEYQRADIEALRAHNVHRARMNMIILDHMQGIQAGQAGQVDLKTQQVRIHDERDPIGRPTAVKTKGNVTQGLRAPAPIRPQGSHMPAKPFEQRHFEGLGFAYNPPEWDPVTAPQGIIPSSARKGEANSRNVLQDHFHQPHHPYAGQSRR